jgi:hypothetical protein
MIRQLCYSLSPTSRSTRQQDKDGLDVPEDMAPTTPSEPSRKKRRGETVLRSGASGHFLTATADPERSLKRGRSGSRKNTTIKQNTVLDSKEVQEETFWDSGEASKWFGELKGEEESNLDIREVVERRIKQLQ